MTNFTNQDVVGAALGLVGFATILFMPGYLMCWLLDLFRFRSRSKLERVAWAIALSFAFSPIFTVLLAWVVPLGVVGVVFSTLIVGVALLIPDKGPGPRIVWNQSTILLLLFGVVGVVVLVGSLVDIQQGNRLFLSVSDLDQAYRVCDKSSK